MKTKYYYKHTQIQETEEEPRQSGDEVLIDDIKYEINRVHLDMIKDIQSIEVTK